MKHDVSKETHPSDFHDGEQKKKRPTVAFLSGSPGGMLAYEKWEMWRGIAQVAHQQDVNLIYIAGEEFETHVQANLYRLICPGMVDGILLWDSFVTFSSTAEAIRAFLGQFAPLPVVTLEISEVAPAALLVNHLEAMQDIFAHLVEEHHYSKIAFFYPRDHRTAFARREVFQQVAALYGLYEARLVGNWDQFLARGLTPGKDFQAVICDSDVGAGEIYDHFQARGYQIPQDFAVIGFNDGPQARGVMPPLTTMRLPFRWMGQRAMELLLSQISGRIIPSQTVLPLRLITRRSCGCLEPLSEQAAVRVIAPSGESLDGLIRRERDSLVDEMARGMGATAETHAHQWAAQILDQFTAEYHHRTLRADRSGDGGFLLFFTDILNEAVAQGVKVNRWHEMLTALRKKLLPAMQTSDAALAEDIWQQARVLIGQIAARAEVQRSWENTRRAVILREIEADLLMASDVDELLALLATSLPRLGIRGCYLALYEDPKDPAGLARLMLAYQDGKPTDHKQHNRAFPAQQFVPDGWLSTDRRYSLLVQSLHHREEPLGFIVFDAEPADVRPEMVFDTLQIQLGTALKGVLLRQDLKKALQDAEDANRHKSGFLSMVSHELRTPLNLIVGLSEMALREYARAEGGSTENLKKFAEQIYTSGQHLDRLIRDVLDLASSQMGKMDIICSEVDVVELLSEASAMGRQLAEQKRLQFRVDIPLRLPPVWGDRTRLRQVLLNLLSNAVKFTARGEIALSASLGVDGILIAVRDTGLGVPLKEQVTIFNEFHQSERTTARGYGGIGLGLAITRRLVELHAGRIWLESSGIEGEGTAFFITLPITTIPGKFKKEADPWQKSTVLIIANEECASETLLQHLQLQGFLVEELVLKDSPDYLSYLKLHPPAAIVLDMAPSAEQGWEIMRLLKEHPDTRDIPVLFYALMSEQDSGAVLELDTLQKPVSASALIQVLEQRGLRGGQADPAVTLLIVDDEPGILEIHSQMAQEALPSARLITAQNGRQALERMRQTKPDLVLLDLMMPEMDGFGVLRAMQEDKDTQGIPVIILSAQTLTERELSLLNRSVAAILGKGLFTSAETLQQIEAVLSRSKRLGSESQRLVRQAMVFIHKHYPEHILRGDIAGFLNVNEQYLSRCFNREIGLSPMVYLNRFRILQAKRMLEHGEYSITKIALAVGFSNQSYFSRMFLREVGMSPRAYQRRWG